MTALVDYNQNEFARIMDRKAWKGEDDVGDPLVLGPELLGLQRVGEERPQKSPKYPTNRRGTPARILKKNKLFYANDYVSGSDLYRSPKKVGLDIVSLDNMLLKSSTPNGKTEIPSRTRSLLKSPVSSSILLPSLHVSSKDQSRSTRSQSKLRKGALSPAGSPELSSTKLEEPEPMDNTEIDIQVFDEDSESVKNIIDKGKYLRVKTRPPAKFHDDPLLSPYKLSPVKRSPKVAKKSIYQSPGRLHRAISLLKRKSNVSRQLDFVSDIDSVTSRKKISRDNGIRLRNLLKLPKAHKWVCFEWFYSHIDSVLFQGDNDFQLYLKDALPRLETRLLSRVNWCKIRRLMGKPRRCSEAFFAEERLALSIKRQKIRALQLRKYTDPKYCRDLPDEIPMQLVIGTRVTARLHQPSDGLFTGVVAAVDTSNNTYRITFDRPGLGTYSVPDIDVAANEYVEHIPLSSFTQKSKFRSSALYAMSCCKPSVSEVTTGNDPILGGTAVKSKLFPIDGSIGDYPIHLLNKIMKLSKILKLKSTKIQSLRDMNSQAERLQSHGDPITVEFQGHYATAILELEKVNRDLNDLLKDLQVYCDKQSPSDGETYRGQQESLKARTAQQAQEMILTFNQDECYTDDSQTIQLISGLTSLLLQVKELAHNDVNAYQLNSLSDLMKEIKTSVDPVNRPVFQNCVEVPLKHIQSGLYKLPMEGHDL